MNQRIVNEELSSIHMDLQWAQSYLDDLQELSPYKATSDENPIHCLRNIMRSIAKSCYKITKGLAAEPDPLG